jgi:phospholipid transport system substrate-binding protein
MPIDYAMHGGTGVWTVYDVSANGVSLIALYRASFANEIRHGGMDGLLASLRSYRASAEPRCLARG